MKKPAMRWMVVVVDFLNITFGDLGLDTSSYNGYYFDIITQSQSFQISASTLDRSDTLTATINTVGLTWN